MDERFVRSEAGRREIKERAHALSRQARNLLLIIDGQRSGLAWVGLVQGCTAADLAQLLAAGLVEPVGAASVSAVPPPAAPPPATAAAPAPAPAPAAPPAAAPRAPLEALVASLNYDQLYTLLTAQARERLGLFKGYRLVLEVEKCSGPDELRALALRFAEQLRATGPDELRAFRDALQAAAA